MAKVRSKRQLQIVPHAHEFTPTPALDVWWPVQETPRFWCPMCGMCADQTRLDDAVYEVKVAIQQYGGRLPGGKAYMEYIYEDVRPYLSENRVEVLRELLSHVDAVKAYLEDELGIGPEQEIQGYIPAPVVEAPKEFKRPLSR